MNCSNHLLRDRDLDRFLAACKAKGLDHIEEVTLHCAQAWAVGDRASAAGSPFAKNIFDGTSANLVERTKDPPLGDGNKLPGDSLIMIFGAAAVVRLGDYGTTAQKRDTQEDLDRTVLRLQLGGARAIEIYGPEFMDYGPPMLAGHDGSNSGAAAAASGPGFAPGFVRKVKPLEIARILGTEQTILAEHFVARTADWGATFTADYMFPALIGRRR
jgi:hypothetical protein